MKRVFVETIYIASYGGKGDRILVKRMDGMNSFSVQWDYSLPSFVNHKRAAGRCGRLLETWGETEEGFVFILGKARS